MVAEANRSIRTRNIPKNVGTTMKIEKKFRTLMSKTRFNKKNFSVTFVFSGPKLYWVRLSQVGPDFAKERIFR